MGKPRLFGHPEFSRGALRLREPRSESASALSEPWQCQGYNIGALFYSQLTIAGFDAGAVSFAETAEVKGLNFC
jgi:hypothetical protein